MRLTLPLALATATAFSVNTLPVRAFPQAGLNLVQIDGDGVQALPDLQRLTTTSTSGQSTFPPSSAPIASERLQPDPLISQANTGAGSSSSPSGLDTKLLPTGKENWTICYNGPLPRFEPFEYLSIRNPKNGEEVERISLTSSRITYSQDRTCMTIDPEIEIEEGERFCALLPDAPNPLPQRQGDEPCCFAVAPPAAAAPAGGGGPWWLLIPVAGVVICALAGCFDSGGGGGSNPSSR